MPVCVETCLMNESMVGSCRMGCVPCLLFGMGEIYERARQEEVEARAEQLQEPIISRLRQLWAQKSGVVDVDQPGVFSAWSEKYNAPVTQSNLLQPQKQAARSFQRREASLAQLPPLVLSKYNPLLELSASSPTLFPFAELIRAVADWLSFGITLPRFSSSHHPLFFLNARYGTIFPTSSIGIV